LDLRNQKLLLVFPQYCFPGGQIRSSKIICPSCLPQLCGVAINSPLGRRQEEE
jgi:hypothetical protein